MSIFVVGLNYRTAPVALREQLTLSGCALHIALDDLKHGSSNAAHQRPAIDEAVIVSTCNRLEIYCSAHQTDAGIQHIEQFLANLQHIDPAELTPYLYQYVGVDACTHLMRVSSGLDSMILGETQILGQVTQAYEDARNAGMTGAILARLFTHAIRAGKRAHSETAISRHTTSVSHAGATLLMDKLQNQAARVVIIGAGEMAVLVAQALKRYAVHDITFMNRTFTRAEELAHEFSAKALTWYQLDQALSEADAVICATGAPHIILYRQDLEPIMQQRQDRPLMLLDIAVPRDIDAHVRELAHVAVYDIDDLQSVVDANLALRSAEIPHVDMIIQQELARFNEWQHSRQVSPVIKTLHEWGQSIAEEEVAESLSRMHDVDERTQQHIMRLAHRLVNRLLREPTLRLRMHASEGTGQEYAHAVRELFALHNRDQRPTNKLIALDHDQGN